MENERPKFAMKINSVNVIEYFGGTIQACHSFNDDPEGNTEAEALFTQMANENQDGEGGLGVPRFSDEDIAVGIEEGFLEDNKSGDGYQLFIVHSQ